MTLQLALQEFSPLPPLLKAAVGNGSKGAGPAPTGDFAAPGLTYTWAGLDFFKRVFSSSGWYFLLLLF